MKRRTLLLAAGIAVVIIVSTIAANALPAIMFQDSQAASLHAGRGWGWQFGPTAKPAISADQAKAAVSGDIANFKVGTPRSTSAAWITPIEDGKGIVASIPVTRVGASTGDQAKSIVADSLSKGWKVGDPRLVRGNYVVPLLDQNGATIGRVRVDGATGEIVRITVTIERAKTIVSDAQKDFKVGEALDGRSVWRVSINYGEKTVMSVSLAKVNTPTSADAVQAVQASIGKGWSVGEPRQFGFVYIVPIIDSNGATIGNIRVDGRTGEILAGFSPIRR